MLSRSVALVVVITAVVLWTVWFYFYSNNHLPSIPDDKNSAYVGVLLNEIPQ